jgi:hypothetical protein
VGWYRYESGQIVPIEEPPEDEPIAPLADEEDPDAYEKARGYTRALELGDSKSLWCLIFEHTSRHEWVLLLVAGRNHAYIISTTIIDLFDLISRFSPVLNFALLDRIHFDPRKLTIKEFLT